jgi:hypothetical protein
MVVEGLWDIGSEGDLNMMRKDTGGFAQRMVLRKGDRTRKGICLQNSIQMTPAKTFLVNFMRAIEDQQPLQGRWVRVPRDDSTPKK